MRRFAVAAGLVLFALPLGAEEGAYASPEAWGEALFLDVNLSKNRTQSCSTCHQPEAGFVDKRETGAGQAVSLGDDGASLGDRNAPTAAYAALTPAFGKTADGKWRGGLFHDGRAATLADQAGGPPLNPIEMGMPDQAAVVARLWEDPRYAVTLQAAGISRGDVAAAYGAMTGAIAAYEGTPAFSTFDSKYDRWLKGEVQLTDQEELGRVLFFSNQFTNCRQCHQLRADPLATDETFTNYQYHNIGVPVNAAARAMNGVTAPDLGLAQNPAVAGDPAQAGKFKVPTLRNVAVTGPYMQNGVFKDLRTVILFYDKYNSRAPARQINPETGAPWGPPEVEGTLSLTELESGPALKEQRIDALVAFLKTLTDARYESLLQGAE